MPASMSATPRRATRSTTLSWATLPPATRPRRSISTSTSSRTLVRKMSHTSETSVPWRRMRTGGMRRASW